MSNVPYNKDDILIQPILLCILYDVPRFSVQNSAGIVSVYQTLFSGGLGTRLCLYVQAMVSHMCMHTSHMTVYINCRKVHTQSAKKWLERLQKEEVPVIVCLTFGDKLYAEHMTKKREHPDKDHMKRLVKEQLSVSCIIE